MAFDQTQISDLNTSTDYFSIFEIKQAIGSQRYSSVL